MNQDIKILYENNSTLSIIWDKYPEASYYSIVGCDNVFVCKTLARTNSNVIQLKKEALKNYVYLRIDAILKSKDFPREYVLHSTNLLKLEEHSYIPIEVSCISSYRGISCVFLTKKPFDKYYVYEKTNQSLQFLLETEDFIITSPFLHKNHQYFIEGYRLENDTYILGGTSDIFTCLPSDVLIPERTDLSIIVPVYNAEVFLARCLDSILFSTFRNKEILLIDDGSTDQTGKIITWYQKKYPSIIKVFQQQNKGVSYARNLGIKNAIGRYIAFVDHDDMVHPYMYEKLYLLSEREQLDIAIAKTIIHKDIHDTVICLDVKKKPNQDFLIYSYDEMFEERKNFSVDNIFFVAVWNKIIKASIVKEHPFPTLNYYEDSAHTEMIYSYIEKFGFAKDAYYVWDKRFQKTIGTSTNHSYTGDALFHHQAYCNALIFSVEKGNPLKYSYICYSIVEDIYRFIHNSKIDQSNSDVFDIYIKFVKKINQYSDLLTNKYIMNYEELYQFVKSCL